MSIKSISKQLVLEKVINKGGSAYIIEATTVSATKDLDRGDKVVLKHCMGYLGSEACDAFIEEANNLEDLKVNLVETGKCSNFPIFYGYTNECLFGSLKKLNKILNNQKISDLLFYYSNYPDMAREAYSFLHEEYTDEFILKNRKSLRIPNFGVIASLYPLPEEYTSTFEIKSFLEDEFEVGCSTNIIMSSIDGFSLQDEPSFRITKDLLFELVYTNASIINYNGQVFGDNNLGNIMVENYPYPRIYKVGATFYYFPPGQRLLIIDAQTLVNSRGVRDLTGRITSRCNQETVKIVEEIHDTKSIAMVMEDVLYSNYKEHIISEQEVKKVLVLYPKIQVWSYSL